MRLDWRLARESRSPIQKTKKEVLYDNSNVITYFSCVRDVGDLFWSFDQPSHQSGKQITFIIRLAVYPGRNLGEYW